MYGAHIQSTERYYITQATIKKWTWKSGNYIFEVYKKCTGSLVYGGVDLLLSGYGLYMGVLRKDAWKLFYYINTDYVHSYQQASGFSLLFEAVADSVTIKSAYDVYNDPEYGNRN